MKLNELQSLEEQILASPMNEMANLYPKQTGLPAVIWFGEVGGQHGPRIKVSNTPGKFDSTNCFVMSVEKDPEILTPKSAKLSTNSVEDVRDWVKLNYDVLMELWAIHESGDGDVVEAFSRLQKI